MYMQIYMVSEPSRDPTAATAAAALDEHAVEATIEYKQKVGLWRKEALLVNKDMVWWVTVSFSRRCRAPLTGFLIMKINR